MENIVTLGGMYFGRNLAIPGSKHDGGELMIGDTNIRTPITWVEVYGRLIADRAICTGISWHELNKSGFIYGRLVWIDRCPYLCRSLRVGHVEDPYNEWDGALDKAGEDDALWHWSVSYFWGQETMPNGNRVYRGIQFARHWGSYVQYNHHEKMGFRPALEPLLPSQEVSKDIVGKQIKVYGPDSSFIGTLQDSSDYDLFLIPSSDAKPIEDCRWCCTQDDGLIVVNRAETAFKTRGLYT